MGMALTVPRYTIAELERLPDDDGDASVHVELAELFDGIV